MTDFATDAVERLATAFEPHRNPERGRAMAAYMRDLFPFLGVPSPLRGSLQREALAGLALPTESDLVGATALLWRLPEREYQYAALDLLTRNVRRCTPSFLDTARELITTKSWWDTVDALASRVVGPLILSTPSLAATMDDWLEDPNVWLRRTAILHQLSYHERTDPARLFRYCLAQAADRDFFIRKAIGWALRQYSKTDAAAVRAFVTEHEAALSPLSVREALLWLNGGRGARRASAGLEAR